MASVAPLPPVGVGPDQVRPGQQLLPGYVVKLLKTIKIPFGTDRTMNGVDVDPTVALLGHIVDCMGALRDVNKVYRAKGSLASRSVGARAMFGFTAELGNLLLDAITFNPPQELKEAATFYTAVAGSILNVFPEIAAQVTKSTGKMLIHHTALKASPMMAIEAVKMVTTAYPAGAWSPDSAGALPLHWITHNTSCNYELISYLISANPKAPWVADVDGYLPLHWAVNQDFPNVDVVAALLTANPSAASKACNKGSLPLHWCVNRETPLLGVVQALLQAHPDAVRTFCDEGWLPIHRCVDRSNVSLNVLRILVELYPQGLQCRNSDGQLPLHRALDHQYPNEGVIEYMLQQYPGSAQVQDDEGYLPLHMALDCASPSPMIVRLILDSYPEAAFQKSKDGLLPLHCAISCVNPIVEIIGSLLEIFPESPEHLALDIVPMDEYADPETWQGEWKEKRWTPLSRAIDRKLDAPIALFKASLTSSLVKGRMSQPLKVISTITPKHIVPGAKPPINAEIREDGSGFGGGPSVQEGGVELPADLLEEPVPLGANGLPLLEMTREEEEELRRGGKYGYGDGYGPDDKDRDRDRHRSSKRTGKDGDRDRDRDRDRERDRDRDRDRGRDGKDRHSRRHRDRDSSRDPGSDRRHRHRSSRHRGGDTDRSEQDTGRSSEPGYPPPANANLAGGGSGDEWVAASPVKTALTVTGTPNTKAFIPGQYKSPKEPPPEVVRSAAVRAEMSSREGMKSRRGGPGSADDDRPRDGLGQPISGEEMV